jgi:hypothetical protein
LVRNVRGNSSDVTRTGCLGAEEQEVQDVLGRLPLRYRLTIWIAGLVSCAGVGGWVALVTPLPLVWSSGAVLGAALGVLVVVGYLNVLERSPNPRQPVDPRR